MIVSRRMTYTFELQIGYDRNHSCDYDREKKC